MGEKIEPGRVVLSELQHAHDRLARTTQLANDPEALASSYGPSGLKGLLQSGFVVRCAVFAAMGGFLFGTDTSPGTDNPGLLFPLTSLM